jgi:hypothetical protein
MSWHWFVILVAWAGAGVLMTRAADWTPPPPTTAPITWTRATVSTGPLWVTVSTKPAEWAMPPDELRARLDRIEANLDRLQAQIRDQGIPLLCLGADGNFTWCAPGQVAPGRVP